MSDATGTDVSLSDAALILHLTPGIGPVTCRRLREHFGSDEAIVAATASQFEEVSGIGARTAASLRRGIERADPAQERALMAQYGVELVRTGCPAYPSLLATIDDPPAAIWVRGELRDEDVRAVALVGSRRCTAYGREQAALIAQRLAEGGITVVSGGALGIDSEAHRGALRVGGRTLVVLGCGLKHVYPPEHCDLFDRIVAEGGAIVSEHSMDTSPRREYFPRRNRIIAGLSLGVVVVEAGRRSGALITARQAVEQGREVFAVPGRVDSPASAGCLDLIRDGEASLVTSHVDVLTGLDTAGLFIRGAVELGVENERLLTPPVIKLNEEQRAIVAAFRDHGDEGELLVDQIVARSQLPPSRVLAELTLLQLQRVIARSHQGARLTALGKRVAERYDEGESRH